MKLKSCLRPAFSALMAFGVTTVLQGSSSATIDLKSLYNKSYDSYYHERDSDNGNFAVLSDNRVVFFNPRLRLDFIAILLGERETLQADFVIFAPSEQSSKLESLQVRRQGNDLFFGRYQIKDTEYDRLMLSPDYVLAYRMARDLGKYPDAGPDFRQLKCTSSLTKLQPKVFLVTGVGGSYKDSGDEYKKAYVVDLQRKNVLKMFLLKKRHSNHTSLLLPDGKVVLIDSSGTAEIEIVDVKNGTSRILLTKAQCDFATVCLNSAGNLVFFGGLDNLGNSSKGVYEVSLQDGNTVSVAKLHEGRSFLNSFSGLANVDLNAVQLQDGAYIISGGTKVLRGDTDYMKTMLDAELMGAIHKSQR